MSDARIVHWLRYLFLLVLWQYAGMGTPSTRVLVLRLLACALVSCGACFGEPKAPRNPASEAAP